MGFGGNYAPRGLSPQMYDMPVIQKKDVAKPRPLSQSYMNVVVSGFMLPQPLLQKESLRKLLCAA